jgi:hypothetical protein
MRQSEADRPDSSDLRVKVGNQSTDGADGDNGDDSPRFLLAVAALVGIALVIFIGFHMYHRDQSGDQANSFARTFIRNSPVVQEQLGKVERVKQIEDQHQSGKHPGWYLDYDVTGRRGSGVVDFRLTPNPDYGVWNVPVAKLDRGHETVALR